MRSLSAAAVAVVCIATASCNKSQTPGAAPAAFPPATVKLETAHTLPLEDTTEYVATLKSLRGTAIQPQIEGQVTDVFVTSGQRVARGDQLVRIDARRQEAAVASQHARKLRWFGSTTASASPRRIPSACAARAMARDSSSSSP